jgi:hypothetical protein
MSFPIGPSDLQLYTTPYGAVYQYSAAENKWLKYTMYLGVTGADGVQGVTGVANFIQDPTFPTILPCELLWNTVDEALFAGISGVGGHWIQISAGSVQGPTGLVGSTGAFGGPPGATGVQGLANFYDLSTFPTVVPVTLLWDRVDEALYAGMTGYGHWIQISAGSKQGATGLNGTNGINGVTGLDGTNGTNGVTGIQGETGAFEAKALANLYQAQYPPYAAPLTGLYSEILGNWTTENLLNCGVTGSSIEVNKTGYYHLEWAITGDSDDLSVSMYVTKNGSLIASSYSDLPGAGPQAQAYTIQSFTSGDVIALQYNSDSGAGSVLRVNNAQFLIHSI